MRPEFKAESTLGEPSTSERISCSLHVQDVDGAAWLMVNQRLPWPVALKVLKLLRRGRAAAAKRATSHHSPTVPLDTID